MKKLFYAIVALSLFATSCDKSDAADATPALKSVALTVKAPEMQTRAFTAGNGASANTLFYAFYNKDGEYLSNISAPDGIPFTDGMKIAPNLIEGEQYKAIFWVQCDDMYELALTGKFENATVTGDPDDICMNPEYYDAFWAKIDIDVTEDYQGQNVTLYRPFAQLNIGAPAQDIQDAENAGIKVGAARVTGFQAPSVFNLGTGATSIPKDFCVSEPIGFKMDNTITIESQEYVIMSTVYVLIDSGSEKELANVVFTTYEHDEGGTDNIVRTFSGVPIQRNHRTFILGNILTSSSDSGYEYVIRISPGFDNDDHIVNQ